MKSPEIQPGVEYVGSDQFDEKILEGSRNKLVLLEFWANQCTPCQTLARILEGLTREFQEECTVARVDVEESPALAARFRIQSLPTVVVFYRGNPLGQFVGTHPEKQIRSLMRLFSKGDRLEPTLSRNLISSRGAIYPSKADELKGVSGFEALPGAGQGRRAMEDSISYWGNWYFEPDRLKLILDREGCVEYTVDLEMCRSSGQVLNQLTELARKGWIQPGDIFGLLNALQDLLHIQNSLCPGGAERHLGRNELGKLVEQFQKAPETVQN